MPETDAAAPQHSNLTDEALSANQRAYEESCAKLEAAKSQHRHVCKRLESDGDSVKVLEAIRRLRRQDPIEALDYQRRFIRHARVALLPLGTQLTLTGEELAPVDLSQQERENREAWDAGEQGKSAGKRGEPAGNNPYPPGTLAHQAWALGHKSGAEMLAQGLVGKRGRPRKVQPDQQQAA